MALPDDIINAGVMDAMIERWPQGAVIGTSSNDRKLLSELDGHPDETIDKLIDHAKNNSDQSNANRLHMEAVLALINREENRRAKTKAKAVG